MTAQSEAETSAVGKPPTPSPAEDTDDELASFPPPSDDASGDASGHRNHADPSWKARNSFTADSPYFGAFCDAEVKQLHILSDSLREIASRTQTMTKTGMLMSEASRRLAASCQFRALSPENEGEESEEEMHQRTQREQQERQIRKQAVGEEMASFLDVFGDVSALGPLW
jgi:hypothetical protein